MADTIFKQIGSVVANALDSKENTGDKGVANGYAPLDSDGLVPVAHLPELGTGGVLDHGELTGLADDDHTQYYNQTRGDARYALTGHDHAGVYEPADSTILKSTDIGVSVQGKLTAGSNISIVNDVISSTGSSGGTGTEV
jgi:hypothetical protein